jgi:hypothetical protein
MRLCCVSDQVARARSTQPDDVPFRIQSHKLAAEGAYSVSGVLGNFLPAKAMGG